MLLPSFHAACLAVSPTTDLLAGTNQSCSLWVDLSWERRMDLSVGAGLDADCATAAAATNVSRRAESENFLMIPQIDGRFRH